VDISSSSSARNSHHHICYFAFDFLRLIVVLCKLIHINGRILGEKIDWKQTQKCPCRATHMNDLMFNINSIEVRHNASSYVCAMLGASAAGISVSLSSSSADYDSQSKATTGEQSTFSSSEVDNLSKRQEHTAISGSHQHVEVMEENMHNYSSNKDVELDSEVEKHSVSMEV